MDKFGPKLLTNGGEVDAASRFGDDVELIGIYFSAHWCPPCRGFTPKLAEFYNTVNSEKKRFEIVFVSHDRDEKSFKEYFATMPWTAVPFDQDEIKEELIGAYKVSGIPKLAILNKKGELKFDEGREKVMSGAAGFPWN